MQRLDKNRGMSPIIQLFSVLQEHEKAVAVAFIEKDILLSVAAKNYMINRASIM